MKISPDIARETAAAGASAAPAAGTSQRKGFDLLLQQLLNLAGSPTVAGTSAAQPAESASINVMSGFPDFQSTVQKFGIKASSSA